MEDNPAVVSETATGVQVNDLKVSDALWDRIRPLPPVVQRRRLERHLCTERSTSSGWPSGYDCLAGSDKAARLCGMPWSLCLCGLVAGEVDSVGPALTYVSASRAAAPSWSRRCQQGRWVRPVQGDASLVGKTAEQAGQEALIDRILCRLGSYSCSIRGRIG